MSEFRYNCGWLYADNALAVTQRASGGAGGYPLLELALAQEAERRAAGEDEATEIRRRLKKLQQRGEAGSEKWTKLQKKLKRLR